MKLPSDVPSNGMAINVPSEANTTAKKLPTLWSVLNSSPQANGSRIEPEYAKPYSDYITSRTPESASALLSALDPVIDESLRSYGGSEAPTVTARASAKKMALEAVARYDPERAKLRTHLLSHLRGLRRITERSTGGVYIPEQWRLDSKHVNSAIAELTDELGREPSDGEIADHLSLPIERIRKARTIPGVVSGSQFEGPMSAATSTDSKAWDRWVDGIYHDLNPVDQVILESSFGLHGKPVLKAGDIAGKVNLSPGAVSQRKLRIQQMLDEYDAFMGHGGH